MLPKVCEKEAFCLKGECWIILDAFSLPVDGDTATYLTSQELQFLQNLTGYSSSFDLTY